MQDFPSHQGILSRYISILWSPCGYKMGKKGKKELTQQFCCPAQLWERERQFTTLSRSLRAQGEKKKRKEQKKNRCWQNSRPKRFLASACSTVSWVHRHECAVRRMGFREKTSFFTIHTFHTTLEVLLIWYDPLTWIRNEVQCFWPSGPISISYSLLKCGAWELISQLCPLSISCVQRISLPLTLVKHYGEILSSFV